MNALHPLGELIQAAQDKNGWSTRDLQRRAEDQGFDMKHSNFSRLKNQDLVSIKGTVIHALSSVLKVPAYLVAQAAMASMGVEVPAAQPALEDVVKDSSEFSARDRLIIQGLVSTIRALDLTTQEEAADYATHMNQAGPSSAMDMTSNSRDAKVNFRSKDDNGAQGKKVPYVDPHAHPDADSAGNVPLPANYYELAASFGRNYGAEEDARARERGEETQDTDDWGN